MRTHQHTAGPPAARLATGLLWAGPLLWPAPALAAPAATDAVRA